MRFPDQRIPRTSFGDVKPDKWNNWIFNFFKQHKCDFEESSYSLLLFFFKFFLKFVLKQIYGPPAPPEEIPKLEVYVILGASAALVVIVLLIIIGLVLCIRGGKWRMRCKDEDEDAKKENSTIT